MNPQNTTPQQNRNSDLDELYEGFHQKHSMFVNKDASGIALRSSDSFISIQNRQESSIHMDSFDDNPAPKKKNKELSKKLSFHPSVDVQLENPPLQEQQDEKQPSLSLKQMVSIKKMSQEFQKKKSIFRRRSMARLGFQKAVWRKNGLKVLVLVSRAVLGFLRLITKIKLKFVDQKIFDIIEDNASSYEYLRRKNLVKQRPTWLDRIENRMRIVEKLDIYLNYFNQFLCYDYTCVFQPDTWLKIVYDLILIVIITCTIFFVPLQYSFYFEFRQNELEILLFETIPGYVFLVEIVVNFNSAYYSRGKIIKNRTQIIKHYILKGNFIWDVLLTTLLFFKSYVPRYLSLLLILRVYRIEDIYNQLITVLNLRDRFSSFLSLIKLIYLLMFISHLIACYWHFLGDYQTRILKDESWLVSYDLYHLSWEVKYVNSLYWAIISTTTVGYGDICPQTTLEKVSTIITTMITSVVFGYMISSIGGIFSQMKEENEKFLNTMASINNYIKKRNLTPQMQLKVRMYFEYSLRQKGNENEIEELINQIPSELKKDIRVDLYSKYLRKVSFIKQALSDTTIESLCMVATECKLQPDEILFKQDEEVDRLVILLNGDMQSYVETSKYIIEQNLLSRNCKKSLQLFLEILQTNERKRKIMLQKFHKGSVFHEREFLLSNKTSFATKALTTVNILVINKKDIMNVLENQHEDLEKFHMLLENTQHNQSYKLAFQSCEICKQNHDFFKCPFTFFQIDKQKMQKEMRKSEQHQRQQDHFRKYKLFPGYRTCRLDYLDCAIQSGLNSFQIQDDDINDEFLRNVGFPMLVLQESRSKHQSVISEKIEEDSEEDDGDKKQKIDLIQIHEQSESESKDSGTKYTQYYQADYNNSYSESGSKYKKTRLTIPKFENITQEEDKQKRDSEVQPNFALMEKVRKFSIAKGIDLGLKKETGDQIPKKKSLMKQKTPKETFKSQSYSTMKSKQQDASYQRSDSGSKNYFQKLYIKNSDKASLTPMPQPNQAALSFSQLADKYRRLSNVQILEPLFQAPTNALQKKQSVYQQQHSLTSQDTPKERNSKLFTNLQQQIQQTFEQYNMIQQIEFEYLLANQHENFIDLDWQKQILNINSLKSYEYYFPHFNIQRVLSKYAGNKKKKMNKKLSQVEFQIIRQQTKAIGKLQKSQTLTDKKQKLSFNSRDYNEV